MLMMLIQISATNGGCMIKRNSDDFRLYLNYGERTIVANTIYDYKREYIKEKRSQGVLRP